MSTLLSMRLKHRAKVLAASAALAATVALIVFSGVAEAQEEDTASVAGAQTTYEPAGHLVVANPGDSLWSISQQRLHPNATPRQIMNEAGRIYELNRIRIGDDPNLILPGQELLVPPAATPTTLATTPPTAPAHATVAGKPATVAERASEPVEEEPAALPDLPRMEAEPAALYVTSAVSSPKYYFIGLELRVLAAAVAGVCMGMITLALVLAIIMMWRGEYGRYSENYALLPKDSGSAAPTSERDSDSEEENNQELSKAQGGGPRVSFGTNPGDGARSRR